MLTQIAGHKLLFTMAAEAEYGPHLRRRFTPLMTGVGPIEAATAVTRALCTDRPDLVVCLGSAGSPGLEQAQVYQVSAVAYRDMDASPLGFTRGCTPFLDLPAEVALPHQIPDLPAASLSTGANIVSGAGYDSIAQDMVDMETYAVLRACQGADVPLIGLRGISDGRADLHHFEDWTAYLGLIDERLAAAVDQLGQALADGHITL